MSKSADGQEARVVMHNSLVRHTLKSFARLGAMEHKIIAAAVAEIDHRSDELPEITLEIVEIAKAAGLNRKDIYEAAKEAAKNLCGEVLEFNRPDNGNLVICSWMAEAEFEKGVIRCSFAKGLKPVLTALKECRTEMELASIMQIGGSAYAHRLYQLACSWRNNHGWKTSIKDLRGQLGVKEGDYTRLFDFKKRVLDTPIQILNERTDVRIAYKKGNKGRTWTHIEFMVLSQSSKPQIKQAEKLPEWDAWFEERCETESGQDTIWATAFSLGLVPSGSRGRTSISRQHALWSHRKAIWEDARQRRLFD